MLHRHTKYLLVLIGQRSSTLICTNTREIKKEQRDVAKMLEAKSELEKKLEAERARAKMLELQREEEKVKREAEEEEKRKNAEKEREEREAKEKIEREKQQEEAALAAKKAEAAAAPRAETAPVSLALCTGASRVSQASRASITPPGHRAYRVSTSTWVKETAPRAALGCHGTEANKKKPSRLCFFSVADLSPK